MGQEEVLKVLRKKKEYLTTRQITEIIGCSLSATRRSVRCLEKQKELKYIIIDSTNCRSQKAYTYEDK